MTLIAPAGMKTRLPSESLEEITLIAPEGIEICRPQLINV
jgi:hypothetical protein